MMTYNINSLCASLTLMNTLSHCLYIHIISEIFLASLNFAVSPH